jgi:biotin carboxyl carrier protein
MKLRVMVDGREVEVDSEQLAGLVEVEPGVYSAVLDGASYEIWVQPSHLGVQASAAGRTFAGEIHNARDSGKSASAAFGSGRQNVTTPMPGKVVRVLVNAGDAVETAQGLIVVEAMKMQNELKAARPGRIVEIRVTEGATVAAGDVLLVLE